MYGLEMHYLLARITVVLMIACTGTGLALFLFEIGKWRKPVLIVHVITGILAMILLLLTYLLAPTIGI
ncbi:hypothetical protein AKJ41_05850 [candidate division MSBL1 archaeon SCGC-AAA259O05]|uniref:Uncharacterized protein n=2 Tax=candidate division MSBL1 TaxID=215777 RepID=A0A133UYA1_9EURY|nr:hypothetical protein AKJ64_00020 [candidate division MSBL1 archaeon SCGC-AAA259E17]KXA99182.1 hypothetical protein AKJ41_05850 [candidate division MSBL1 archaeon SCGC-AAA259O05]